MRTRTEFAVVESGFKVELFQLNDDPHDRERFRRRVRMVVLGRAAWAPTAEDVIPAILAVGHAQLVIACEQTPEASVRILNPLASGDYADVACSSILEGTRQTSDALTSDEKDGPIGTTQQKFGPISLLACGIGTIGTALFTRYALCPGAPTERDRTSCNDVGLWGGTALTVVCTLPFLPIFF